ncbi:3-octaprenyl-4-hydroxybenzoate carboxy-lyase [Methylobacterium phyllosphaerae]|uniref:2,5-furandicarboxylate decarboxylase 1 n=1 Tax=Methylobacterium phyllosphaerae TaxID=418223 RepID=A0AAE8L8L8_9HYPH|nr:UbiD family decarboxylase [Methylobacterium phyllosphaerae]APT34772.1 3-octaprenyl-4-hydroxybenzoate carboxy-lyase [Methylobacterium phyllosphaerae]SFH42976.1 2,5-furandicarboxylate decarboxylase 1 [Methylobacterium phyllosphaerae]
MNATTPVRSLRDWLDRLSGDGRLAIARPGIGLRHEAAAVANRLDGRQASLFPQPGGHPGTIVSGLVSSRAWMAEALGTTQDRLVAHFQQAAAQPLPWHERNSAPAQEVVHREGLDILKLLPVPTLNEHDSGPYISAGLMISRDPETGLQNVAILRCQISGPDRIGVLVLPRHTDNFYRKAEAQGRGLEVALVVGVDPACLLASQAIVPLGHDELEIAGALTGQPLDVIKCLTNDVRVPANAEIVIEGRLLPEIREPEGPFGEFPQYYGERAKRHVMQVDAVTHRRDPIFHMIVGGGLEHLLLGAIPREATILATLQRSFPGVEDVHLSLGGVGRYHLYVRLRKTQEGEAKNVLLGAFAAHYDIKHAVVVDTDVDIHDPQEVEWAVSTRFQADRDLVVIPHAQGSKLDPSGREGVGAKMGLDATVLLDAPPMKFKRIRVPGEAEVDLDAVLAPGADWRAVIG